MAGCQGKQQQLRGQAATTGSTCPLACAGMKALHRRRRLGTQAPSTWHGMVAHGMAWHGMAPDLAWHACTWHGMAPDLAWHACTCSAAPASTSPG
eukprot:359188-Chlamydomonas_euryale.AAC.3